MANGTLKNTLDLVLTDDPKRIDQVIIGEQLGKASQHHLTLRFSLKVDARIPKQWSSKKFAFKRGDYEGLCEHFRRIDWDDKLKGQNVTERYAFFVEQYELASELFIPKLGNIKKSQPPWLTDEVKNLSRSKARLWHKLKTRGAETKRCAVHTLKLVRLSRRHLMRRR